MSDPRQIDLAVDASPVVSTVERPARGRETVPWMGSLLPWLGPNVGAVIGFVLIVVAGSLASPTFLTFTNIRNVFLQSAMLGVLAVGGVAYAMWRRVAKGG